MKVITSIYLNCRPDLRDEWLTGTEVDDASDAQVGTADYGGFDYFLLNSILGAGTCVAASSQVL
jgi:hypothetical protein